MVVIAAAAAASFASSVEQTVSRVTCNLPACCLLLAACCWAVAVWVFVLIVLYRALSSFSVREQLIR